MKIDTNRIKCLSLQELVKEARQYGFEHAVHLGRRDLLFKLMNHFTKNNDEVLFSGLLEVLQDNFGFLRNAESNYLPGVDDIYISPTLVKEYSLRTGDTIEGHLVPTKPGEKYLSMETIDKVNYNPVKEKQEKIPFDSLTPLYPEMMIPMELPDCRDVTGRIIDLVAPIGAGQRSLIVSPPRAGKTTILQSIARSIRIRHPELYLIVLLIDERPEEVTDMLNFVKKHGRVNGTGLHNCEVISSTFDEPAYRHIQIAEVVLEKAKRLVEYGNHVVILLDSITRLARAYNAVVPSSGKVLTGGVDSNALQKPKRFLGAARNTTEGGSLSILSTALTETGSKMDEVIFEEFKGTGNSELVIDRKIADRRIFPAVDILKSGTRREELLVEKDVLSKMWILRRLLARMGSVESMEFLLDKIKATGSNENFFNSMNS